MGRGRSDQDPRARGRARRGAVRHRRDPAAGRRGRVARGDRGLLPDQRAVAGARGHARARGDPLPGDRRHEVLRARRDQGRDRLPDDAGQPAGRRRVHADRQLARGAGSARPRSRACSRSRTRSGSRSGTPPPSPSRCRASGAAAVKALRRFMATMHVLRERADGGRADRRAAGGGAARDRLPGGARGRAHDRGAGPDREPRGARQRRRRVRRGRRRRPVAGRVPPADRADRRRRRRATTTRAWSR